MKAKETTNTDCWKIGNIKIDSKLVLAPMAGYTDIGFRRVCKLSGAGLTYTEMVSAKGLVLGNKKTESLLLTTRSEKPKAVQLFGHEPEIMVKAAKHPLLQKFDIIDINMGCPMPKIVKNGDGCALMKDIDLASKIIMACKAATTKPITVKFRKGWNDNQINAVEFAKMCEKSGADAITIHGRYANQMYFGASDISIIKEVAQAVKIPVIASGDIKDANDAERICNQTGATAAMIGRAAVGNPSVFGKRISPKRAITLQIDSLKKHFPSRHVVQTMRKHLTAYLKQLKIPPEKRRSILEITNLPELEQVIGE